MYSLTKIQDRIRGSLAGLAVGDALGMPVEIMTAAEIRAALGPQGVTGLISPIQRRVKDTRELAAGMTTDDTQLAAATARSLIRCSGFCIRDQAQELVREFDRSVFGWGRTTRRAAKRLAAELEGYTADPDSLCGGEFISIAPEPRKPGKQAGNGPAMKVAPLALFRFVADGGRYQDEPLLSQTFELGMLTHGDPRAAFCSTVVAAVITRLLELQRDDRVPDHAYGQEIRATSLTTAVIMEDRYQFYRRQDPTLSSRLAEAFQEPDSSVAELADRVGTGCFCLESVPFALAMASRQPTNYSRAVLETVNAGGDTDTTAAIVGAIVGVIVGLDGIPDTWLRRVPNALEIAKLADPLIMAARRSID
jgi:ADP-ribosylglycohydrolase